MGLEETVIHKGRPHLVRGLQPVSVADRRVLIQDLESGEHRWVPLGELDQEGGGGG